MTKKEAAVNWIKSNASFHNRFDSRMLRNAAATGILASMVPGIIPVINKITRQTKPMAAPPVSNNAGRVTPTKS